jgi:hypothetical protein
MPPDEPRRVRERATLLDGQRNHPLLDAHPANERDVAADRSTALPGSRPGAQHALVVEPRLDVVLGEPPADIGHLLGDDRRVANAGVVAVDPAQGGGQVPPG